MSTGKSFHNIGSLAEFAGAFPVFCIYNSNNHQSDYPWLAAFSTRYAWEGKNTFPQPDEWNFGFLGYDLKNKFENLRSEGMNGIDLPDAFFFKPDLLVKSVDGKAPYFEGDASLVQRYKDYFSHPPDLKKRETSPIKIWARTSKQVYINRVNRIKEHIRRGDVYELNYCQEFYAAGVDIDPADLFRRLNAISQAPFSAYCRFGEVYVISSSPERFLKKQGAHLISQPIKGTRPRSTDAGIDHALRNELGQDEKERSENVMIVDLVRNDLSRIARKGTVKVDELFGIYSFLQVHQMISTISCELRPDVSFDEILRATFPMGSMTGAPKVRAMQLIEEYEAIRRGLYSGALGYMDPQGNFDFSVVIRSIFYNAQRKYLSFMVGSAITDKSDPEKEYEECLVKAKALIEALNGQLVNAG